MLGTAPRPNHAPRPVDCADSDPATWRMRAGVPLGGKLPKPSATQAFLDSPPEGAEPGPFPNWFTKAEQRAQVQPRVQGRPRDDEREMHDEIELNTRLRARRSAGIPTPEKLGRSAEEDVEPGIAGLRVAATGGAVGAGGVLGPRTEPRDRRSSVGAVLGRTVRPPDVNRAENNDTVFDRYTPEGGAAGAGMVARPSARIVALGAIYPIRAATDIRTDGVCITRMNVEATPVKFDDDPGLTGVARYTVQLYANDVREPVGTLDVTPAAVATTADEQARGVGKLHVPAYVAKVREGSAWTVPGKEALAAVTAEDVSTVYDEPVWDRRLMQTVEATIYQLATRRASMTTQLGAWA